MELLLLKLVAVLRPLGSVEYAQTVFDVLGIGLFALVAIAFLANSAVRKIIQVTGLDVAILTFSFWCLCIYVIYFEQAYIRDVSKVLIPLLSYVVAKNVIREREQYTALLFWMIAGFALPALVSAILIAQGKGVQYISYWTGVARFQGAYEGSHVLGHSMALFIMIMIIFLRLRAPLARGTWRAWMAPAAALVLGAVALYNIYMSQVRSAIVGLLVFLLVYLLAYNKKLLVVGALAAGLTAAATVTLWLPALIPEIAAAKQGARVETLDYGSGRPRMWLNDLEVFADLSIDRKIAGVGIGNRGQQSVADEVLRGHSDWLELLTQTGAIGLLLFAAIQIMFLRAILRMPGSEKFMFLALFAAVQVMMVVSNSYVWRIQVGHLYYLALAYVGLRTATQRASDGAPAFAARDVMAGQHRA